MLLERCLELLERSLVVVSWCFFLAKTKKTSLQKQAYHGEAKVLGNHPKSNQIHYKTTIKPSAKPKKTKNTWRKTKDSPAVAVIATAMDSIHCRMDRSRSTRPARRTRTSRRLEGAAKDLHQMGRQGSQEGKSYLGRFGVGGRLREELS